MTSLETLKQYFGYEEFRTGQEEIVQALTAGQDVLAVMPTGAGKSLCYQVPAMMLPGVTVVVSPLISLMQDQVKSLNEAGIRAAYINSSLSETQMRKALELAAQGVYKIIYAAPERLETPGFQRFAESARISLLAVDEAHCISQWGQDFRPSYLRIADFIAGLSHRPTVGAFTATATEEVREDIRASLGLQDPLELTTGFDRPNLHFDVQTPKNKDAFVLQYLAGHPEDSGIIYCATRKNVDTLAQLLQERGISALPYHAGLDSETRRDNQSSFVYDKVQVMVATNAFGMGIDKSNVRFVIHYNMPQSMENYYQEAGRAGRDGEPADCILLFAAADVMMDRFLVEKDTGAALSEEDAALVKERSFQRLGRMQAYCKTTRCLRASILSYFGEKAPPVCGKCGNCCGDFVETDLTKEARAVLNCVAELRGHLGASTVVGILKGGNTAKNREMNLNRLRTFGLLKEEPKERIQLTIDYLLSEDYLSASDGQFPVLFLGPNVGEFRDPEKKLIVRSRDKVPERAASREELEDCLTSLGYDLVDTLKALRFRIAQEIHMPPYIVFSDRTLKEMVRRLPTDDRTLLQVPGVSLGKCEHYGSRFLAAIRDFQAAHPGQVTKGFIRAERK